MKKTDRKNKTNLTITWPKNTFTVKELNVANPEFVPITLRVRLKKAIDNGEVTDIGVIHNGKGRPTLVFVHGQPNDDHVREARAKNVVLKSNLTINVMSVTEQQNNVEQIEIDVTEKKSLTV